MQTREIIYDKQGNVIHVASKGKVNIKRMAHQKAQPSTKLLLTKAQPYIIDETDSHDDKFYISTSTPIIKVSPIPKMEPVNEKSIAKVEPVPKRITSNKVIREPPLSMFQNIQLRWRMR